MRPRVRLLFFFASLLIFLASIYVVYRGVISFREARILDDIVSRIDARIDAGRLGDIPHLLDEASEVVSTPANALRLLKRAFALAELTEDYGSLRERSKEWHRRFSEDSRLTALAVFSALRAEGDKPDALEALRPQERFFDDHPHLGAAYLLFRYSDAEPPLRELGVEARYPYRLLALNRASPATLFFEAAEATGRKEYAVNAILQLASGGVVRDALRRGEGAGLAVSNPLLTATLAYDVGDWEKAADLLEPMPAGDFGSIALRSDAMYLSGGRDTAARGYETLFRAGEPLGPRAFNNAALIPTERSDRLALLREGLRRYPGDAILVAALDGYLSDGERGRYVDQLRRRIADREAQSEMNRDPSRSRAAVRLEQSLEADDTGEPGVEELVLYLLVEADRRPPEANAAQLWALANRSPESRLPRRYLAWFLAGLGRTEELAPAVEGPRADVSRSLAFYRGLYHNSRGQFEEAFVDFRSAHHGRFAWQAAYNAAVIGLKLGRMPEVREILRNAQGEAWYRLSDFERSRLKLMETRLFIREGNRRAALRAAREALALAPESTAAIRLYDALEDE